MLLLDLCIVYYLTSRIALPDLLWRDSQSYANPPFLTPTQVITSFIQSVTTWRMGSLRNGFFLLSYVSVLTMLIIFKAYVFPLPVSHFNIQVIIWIFFSIISCKSSVVTISNVSKVCPAICNFWGFMQFGYNAWINMIKNSIGCNHSAIYLV